MKKNIYTLITITACLVSCVANAQEPEKKFDSNDFYKEYVEPLNGLEIYPAEVNEFIRMSMIAGMNEEGQYHINSFKTNTGFFDGEINDWYSGVAKISIKLLDNYMEDYMDWMRLLNEHKDKLPQDYYSKRMKELEEAISIASTAKTYLNTIVY